MGVIRESLLEDFMIERDNDDGGIELKIEEYRSDRSYYRLQTGKGGKIRSPLFASNENIQLAQYLSARYNVNTHLLLCRDPRIKEEGLLFGGGTAGVLKRTGDSIEVVLRTGGYIERRLGVCTRIKLDDVDMRFKGVGLRDLKIAEVEASEDKLKIKKRLEQKIMLTKGSCNLDVIGGKLLCMDSDIHNIAVMADVVANYTIEKDCGLKNKRIFSSFIQNCNVALEKSFISSTNFKNAVIRVESPCAFIGCGFNGCKIFVNSECSIGRPIFFRDCAIYANDGNLHMYKPLNYGDTKVFVEEV